MDRISFPPMAHFLPVLRAAGLFVGSNEDETEDDKPVNEDFIKLLGMLDPHDMADLIHGTTRDHKKAVPHPQRFWAREGLHMDSRTFSTMFRCMLGHTETGTLIGHALRSSLMEVSKFHVL